MADVISVLDALLDAGKSSGTVRDDVGALDVTMLIKGACVSAATLGEPDEEMLGRHIDLVRAAISAPGHARPLRGHSPTLDDIERTARSLESRD